MNVWMGMIVPPTLQHFEMGRLGKDFNGIIGEELSGCVKIFACNFQYLMIQIIIITTI